MMLQLKEVLGRSISDLSLARKVVQCKPEATVAEVTKMLQDANGGTVLIIHENKIQGIFTERDVLKKVTLNATDPKTIKISTLMTPNPVSVKRQTTLNEVLDKMRQGKFRHLVVVDAYGNAEGVVSMRDIMDHLSDIMMQSLKNP